jgi:serine/threonine protein kinase
MALKTCVSPEILQAFDRGTLPPEESADVAAHLEQCSTCEDVLNQIETRSDPLLAALVGEPNSDPLADESSLRRGLELLKRLPRSDRADVEAARPGELPEQTVIRDYQLLRKLGAGGMGAVYLARHVHLEKLVAIKVLSPERMQDRHAVSRFRREMKAVGQLDHPHLVRAHDAGESNGTHFLVMEYVDGVDLSELARRYGPLPVADACELIRQAALGLQDAHEHGLVHRDIKPSNLMLTRPTKQPQCTVKILDMGLALLQHQAVDGGGEMTIAGQAMGTADYMAPEQVTSSHDVDIRSDIYSLGCTLFKLLVGTAPFGAGRYDTAFRKMMAHVNDPVPKIGELRGDVPEQLAQLIERMLAKQPGDRPARPADIAEELLPFSLGHNVLELLCDLSGPSADHRQVLPVEQETTSFIVSSSTDTTAERADEPESVSPVASLSSATADAQPTATHQASVTGETAHAPGDIPAIAVQPQVSKRRTIPLSISGRLWILGACAALLFAAIVITIQTRDGTLILTVDARDAKVHIDGEQAEVEIDNQGRYRISVKPGTHTLLVTGPGGQRLESEGSFTIRPGGATELTARLVKKMPTTTAPAGSPDSDRAVAEWVLQHGGWLKILVGNREESVGASGKLPERSFELYEVGLTDNPDIRDDDLDKFRNLKQLSYLTLGNTPITDVGLLHLQELKSLTYLCLSQTKVTDAGIANLKVLTNLRGLNVVMTGVTGTGLGPLRQLPDLVKLEVGGPSTTDADLLAISQFNKLTLLAAQKSPQITDAGTRELHRLENLGLLDLTDTQVTSVTVKLIASIKRLQQLNLARTAITDRGLGELAQLPELISVDLSGTSITDAGINHLTGCSKLQVLELNKTRATNESVTHLSQLKSLTNLSIQGTLISEAGYKRVQTALPNCKIDWSLPPDAQVSVGGGEPFGPTALVARPAKLKGVRRWTIDTAVHREEIRDIVSHDSDSVITYGLDGTVRLWDAHSGTLKRIIFTAPFLRHLVHRVPTGQLLITGRDQFDNGPISIWDIETFRLIRQHTPQFPYWRSRWQRGVSFTDFGNEELVFFNRCGRTMESGL